MAVKVDCEVLGEEGVFGDYSNAVRVVRDGEDFLLDFCVYSNREKRARLMSRIRIHQSFLQAIIERLAEELPEGLENVTLPLEYTEGLLRQGDNLILFTPEDKDEC